jgi:hypothetical protein
MAMSLGVVWLAEWLDHCSHHGCWHLDQSDGKWPVGQDLWHNKQLQQHAIATLPRDTLGTEETRFCGISKSALLD